jgi:hypothetical protein
MPTATNNAADLLENALAMLDFLANVSPALATDSQVGGINDKAAFGLGLIFDHIHATIDQARALI